MRLLLSAFAFILGLSAAPVASQDALAEGIWYGDWFFFPAISSVTVEAEDQSTLGFSCQDGGTLALNIRFRTVPKEIVIALPKPASDFAIAFQLADRIATYATDLYKPPIEYLYIINLGGEPVANEIVPYVETASVIVAGVGLASGTAFDIYRMTEFSGRGSSAAIAALREHCGHPPSDG